MVAVLVTKVDFFEDIILTFLGRVVLLLRKLPGQIFGNAFRIVGLVFHR